MRLIPTVLSLVALASAGAVQAQATVKEDGQFRAAVGAGASYTSGNSSSTTLSLTADAVRATKEDKITLYGNLQYARANGVTSNNRAKAGGRYDWNLSSDLFAFGALDGEMNKPANLSSRISPSAGMGWHVIKTADTTFDVFGGAAYTADRYVNATLIDNTARSSYSYWSLVLGEESTHALSDTTAFKQRLVIKPNLTNSGMYTATFDAGVSVAMTKTLNLTAGLSVNHNSDPGVGYKSTDTLLTTGVSMKFD